MNFNIVEKIRNHNEWDSIKGVANGLLNFILFLILVPFLLIALLLSVFKQDKADKIVYDWVELNSNDNIKLLRKFIDENELPDDLDYPEEPNDIYLCRIRSDPEIQDLRGIFFDYQHVVIDQGVFLLSFNAKGKGMSIWYVDECKYQLEKVKDLDPSWWNFGEKNGIITLSTTLNKKDINLEIEVTGYNK